MHICLRLLTVLLSLLIGGTSWAQEPKGFLGIELRDVTKEEAEALGWEAPRGIKVVKSRDGGPAANAGVQVDDVIISLDGREVENTQAFVDAVGGKGVGAP